VRKSTAAISPLRMGSGVLQQLNLPCSLAALGQEKTPTLRSVHERSRSLLLTLPGEPSIPTGSNTGCVVSATLAFADNLQSPNSSDCKSSLKHWELT